jgi:hypothetical protein
MRLLRAQNEQSPAWGQLAQARRSKILEMLSAEKNGIRCDGREGEFARSALNLYRGVG